GNATAVDSNPQGASFKATFPTDGTQFTPTPNGNVRGVVLAQSGRDGKGVRYDIMIDNLPDEGGPFLYHIHTEPVPPDGNCNATLAHLDPFERGESPPCNAALPMTCQVGDLAGKYGAITTSPFVASYTDSFTATGDDTSFIGNLSVVVHFANKTRITCANFQQMGVNGLLTSL
ncbi:superoxide dismutase, partial [Diaporthe sp. PMI_573]